MDDKDEDHQDELIIVVDIVPINEKSMNQIKINSIEVKLDEYYSNSMTSHNKWCSVSNHKTLKGKVTHQGAREVMASIWHDVNYEHFFSLLPIFMHFSKVK